MSSEIIIEDQPNNQTDIDISSTTSCINCKKTKPFCLSYKVLEICDNGCKSMYSKNCDDCYCVFLPITFIVDLVTLPCTSVIWLFNKNKN